MTDSFQVKEGPHQGFLFISPLLFNTVIDVITRDVTEGPPWCLFYADDEVLVAENKELERVEICSEKERDEDKQDKDRIRDEWNG